MPNALNTWEQWLNKTMDYLTLDQNLWRWLFVITGTGMIAAPSIIKNLLKKERKFSSVRFFGLLKKSSPIKIEFEENYYQDREEDGHPVRYYWCFIHNRSSKDIKGVTVDLINDNGCHRLSFHNGDIPEKTVSNKNKERVNLVSYKDQQNTKNRILVLNTNENINIDFGVNCIFKVEVHVIGCPPISQDFAACVKTIKGTPILELKQLENKKN